MMRAPRITLLVMAATLVSGCVTVSDGNTERSTDGKRRGLEPNEMNDGGLPQAPPPPDDGESAVLPVEPKSD